VAETLDTTKDAASQAKDKAACASKKAGDVVDEVSTQPRTCTRRAKRS